MEVEKYAFFHPTSFIVTGSSQSGKTTWVYNLLKNKRDLFKPNIPVTLLFYKTWQDKYDLMKAEGLVQYFIEGLPEQEDFISQITQYKNTGGCLCFFDDLGDEIKTGRINFVQLFTVFSHHLKASVILLVHYLFEKHLRQISLNTQHFIFTESPRDSSQIASLGRQSFPNTGSFLADSYRHALEQRKFAYITVSLDPGRIKQLRVVTNIFKKEKPIRVYIPKRCKTKMGDKSFTCMYLVNADWYRNILVNSNQMNNQPVFSPQMENVQNISNIHYSPEKIYNSNLASSTHNADNIKSTEKAQAQGSTPESPVVANGAAGINNETKKIIHPSSSVPLSNTSNRIRETTDLSPLSTIFSKPHTQPESTNIKTVRSFPDKTKNGLPPLNKLFLKNHPTGKNSPDCLNDKCINIHESNSNNQHTSGIPEDESMDIDQHSTQTANVTDGNTEGSRQLTYTDTGRQIPLSNTVSPNPLTFVRTAPKPITYTHESNVKPKSKNKQLKRLQYIFKPNKSLKRLQYTSEPNKKPFSNTKKTTLDNTDPFNQDTSPEHANSSSTTATIQPITNNNKKKNTKYNHVKRLQKINNNTIKKPSQKPKDVKSPGKTVLKTTLKTKPSIVVSETDIAESGPSVNIKDPSLPDNTGKKTSCEKHVKGTKNSFKTCKNPNYSKTHRVGSKQATKHKLPNRINPVVAIKKHKPNRAVAYVTTAMDQHQAEHKRKITHDSSTKNHKKLKQYQDWV